MTKIHCLLPNETSWRVGHAIVMISVVWRQGPTIRIKYWTGKVWVAIVNSRSLANTWLIEVTL